MEQFRGVLSSWETLQSSLYLYSFAIFRCWVFSFSVISSRSSKITGSDCSQNVESLRE